MSQFTNLTAGTIDASTSIRSRGTLTVDGATTITGALTASNVVVAGTAVTGSTLGTATSGTIAASHENSGLDVRSTFTLTAARIPVTDGAGSGSHGTLKLFTFPAGGVSFLGSRQNYTAFVEGAALTTAAGDAAFKIGLGTTAIAAAADAVLATTEKDIGGEISLTNSGGTSAGTAYTGAGTVKDGSATNATLNLNWSGSAATIDATSTIDVTGTITVVWVLLGDD